MCDLCVLKLHFGGSSFFLLVDGRSISATTYGKKWRCPIRYRGGEFCYNLLHSELESFQAKTKWKISVRHCKIKIDNIQEVRFLNQRLFLWSLASALAGFLFGFDTIVISGVEQKIESIWNLDSTMHGLCMSAALWGTVLGALLGGWPTERFGRRKTLLWIGVLYFVSAVGSGIAPDQNFFMIARFIGGLGVGIATVASPLYISELSPPRLRGRLAGMFCRLYAYIRPEGAVTC